MTATKPELPTIPVFENGTDGIACYRIPSLVVMGSGELLAVAEARVVNCLDHGGPIRLVARISGDHGQTWGPLIEIARNVLPDGTEQVAQNPSPVVDLMDPEHPQGKIVLLFNKAEHGERAVTERASVRRYVVIESTDHGRTWTNERDITEFVHRPNLPHYTAIHDDAAERYTHPDDWRATFPPVGHAIQLRGGIDERPETRGRLFFSCYVTTGDDTILQGRTFAIWSDDHGATWHHSDPSPFLGVNEMMAVEQANGDVLVNFRNYTTDDFTADPNGRGQLVYRFGADGSVQVPDRFTEHPELPMPGFGLQGSIIRSRWPEDTSGKGVFLYSGADHREERVGMTVWLSDDEGQTWPVKRLVDPGPSAYSDMAVLPDGRIALLYELGGDNGMDLAVFSLDWVRGNG